jgi:biopolymer transport protein ExbD
MELEHGLRQIDIAPLIDMVFQLLIFFMLTSTFILQSSIKVNLPKAVTSKITNRESLSLTISSENIIYLEGRVVTLKELKSELKESSKKPILIRADRKASLGRVVEVWDICRELGIEHVNIATDKE